MKKNAKQKVFATLSCIRNRCFFVALACCLWAGLPVASAYGQTQQKKMTLKVADATVLEALHEANRLCGNRILFMKEEVEREKAKVTVDVTEQPILEVVRKIVAGTSLACTEKDGRVVVVPVVQKETIVRGTVSDDRGNPLPGVTVMIKGTGMGVVTDAEGKYALQLPGTQDVRLLFTFIGMKTQEIAYAGQKELNVSMHEEATQIDEVVITGYQNVDRRKNTSAVTSVKAEDIMIPGVASIDKMLEGQIPDMILMTNSGEVGVVPKIRIRGTSTLIGNREPIWVVDGIIVQDPVNIEPEELNDPDYINRIGNAIAGLNPQDIERLDILKDAAATAIYGTKAANGVIVITTKKGRIGRPVVRYNMTTTFRQRPRYTDNKINLMDSKERIQFSKELFEDHYVYNKDINMVGFEKLMYDLYQGVITPAEFNTQLERIETMNTDWFGLLTKDSWSHQHTLSVSGGSETARYYGSIGYTRDNDVIRGDHNERYTAALNMDVNMAKWLVASFSLNGNVSKRVYYPSSIAPMNYAYNSSRAIPAFDEEGEYAYYKKKVNSDYEYNYNILNELDNSSYEQEGSGVTLNANLQFKFTDWLNANAIVSYSASNTVRDEQWGEKTWYAASLRRSEYGVALDEEGMRLSTLPFGGELSHQENRNNSYTVRLQLNANKFFGTDNQHNIFASAGYEMSSTTYKGYGNTTRGYYPDRGMAFIDDIDLTKYPNYAGWMSKNVPTLTHDLTNMISGYISASYSYRGWFTLNGNARVDGSNRFGDQSNHRFLPVWSASANWNLSEINWLQRDWIDLISLKTSFGYQGNMLSDQSPVMIIKKYPTNSYFNEQIARLERNANPELKWEKTSSYNLGLDLSLFQRKLMVEASYYIKHTKDAFMTKRIASMNGVANDSYVVNRGNVDNSGYSVALTVSPVNTKDVRWTLSTSFSRTINKVKNDPDGDTYELEDFLDGTAIVKDKAVGTFYSYKFIGLSPVDGGPLFDDMEYELDRLNGLSKYDTYTRVLEASGRREPFMSGSLNTSVRYKNWRLNGSFAYSLGGKIRMFGMYSAASDGSMKTKDICPEQNMNRSLINRWKNPGDERHTNIPVIFSDANSAARKYAQHWSAKTRADELTIQKIASSAWDMYDYGNHRVVSSNYLKCSNISLTYEFGERLISKAGISRLEISLSGSNLFTVCSKKLDGQTPTQSGFAEIQLSDRPTYSIGLNVSF